MSSSLSWCVNENEQLLSFELRVCLFCITSGMYGEKGVLSGTGEEEGATEACDYF